MGKKEIIINEGEYIMTDDPSPSEVRMINFGNQSPRHRFLLLMALASLAVGMLDLIFLVLTNEMGLWGIFSDSLPSTLFILIIALVVYDIYVLVRSPSSYVPVHVTFLLVSLLVKFSIMLFFIFD